LYESGRRDDRDLAERIEREQLAVARHDQVLMAVDRQLEELLDTVFRAFAADTAFLRAAEGRNLGRDDALIGRRPAPGCEFPRPDIGPLGAFRQKC